MSVKEKSNLEGLHLACEMLMIRELESRGYIVRRKEDTRALSWNRTFDSADVPDFIFRDEAVKVLQQKLTEEKIVFSERRLDPTAGFGRNVLIKTAEIRLLMPLPK